MNQATGQATARPWPMQDVRCNPDNTVTLSWPDWLLAREAVNQHSALLAVAEAAKAVADHASQSMKDVKRYGERSDYNIAKPAIERLKSALSQLETTKH